MECDSIDAVILRFIIDFFNSGAMKIRMIDDVPYFWVHYDTIISEIPIIGIKKQSVRDRLDKYVEQGLMGKAVVKDNTGTYTYFRFVKDKYEVLVRDLGRTGTQIPVRTGVQIPVRTGTAIPPKDSSTTDNYSITNSVLCLFDAWEKRPELYRHKRESVFKHINKRHERIVEEIGVEESIKAVNNYADILASNDHYFSYKWTFWDFITRGIYKFLDEADPKKSFSSKKEQYDPKKEEKDKFLKELLNGDQGD